MNVNTHYSDEDLQRFVDGELDGESAENIHTAMRQDMLLAARVRSYRYVNQSIRDAFESVNPPGRQLSFHGLRFRRPGLAVAVALLPLVFVSGWLSNSLLKAPEQNQQLEAFSLPVQNAEQLNTLFHIDSSDPRVVENLLNRVEAALAATRDDNVHIEVLANDEGLNMLRPDKSAYAQRVQELMDNYDNLSFVACSKTIKTLQKQGIKVRLIDSARETDGNALDHVIDRLRKGWGYIKA